MLPTASSSQNLAINTSNLGLPLPPRSSSSRDLAGTASGSSTPGYFRSSSTLQAGSGPQRAGSAGSGSPAAVGTSNVAGSALNSARESPFPPASPRLANPHSHVSTPVHAPSHSPYHANYDARLIASTINKIESNSGIGAAGSAIASKESTSATSNNATHTGQNAESDAWTAVCIRSLPLFNGEGQRGYIEDLNDLVSTHVKRSIERHGLTMALVTALTNDLLDLLAMGMLTLNAKLVELSDEKLLIRVTEVWNFFFIGCLPYVEGIFLPLRTDPALRPSNSAGSARSLHSASSNMNRSLEPIDIRSIALRSFRDHLILPIVDRLARLFSHIPASHSTQPVEPSAHPNTHTNVSPTARTASARRLQMVSILISIQTNDDRQMATEQLGKALRAGMERRPSLGPTNSLNKPGSGANGLSGLYDAAGYYSAVQSGGKEAERKAWRQGRQMRSAYSSVDQAAAATEGEPAQRRQDQRVAEEQRIIDQLRSPDLDPPEPPEKPEQISAQPAMYVV